MFKIKRWKDMNEIEKWRRIGHIRVPFKILLFPIMFLIKLYKWTYGEEES